MKSYVITIYRDAATAGPGLLIGTFSDPVTGQERVFSTLDELHALIDVAADAPERRQRTKANDTQESSR